MSVNGNLPSSQPFGQIFNGGTPGKCVSPGQYAYDWMIALGATFTLTPAGFTYDMPLDWTGLQPVAIPQQLAMLLINERNSVRGAIVAAQS